MPFNPPILAAIDELDALRKTRDDHWQIPRPEGELLHHIALTANAMDSDRQACLDAGMEDFLSKPFQVSDLQDRLETAATIVKAMKG